MKRKYWIGIVLILVMILIILLNYSNVLFIREREYSEYYCIVNGEKLKREEFYELYSRRGLSELNYCNCYPKEGKDKFAVIMKKDSQFYSPELKDKLDDYFEAINSDLGIDNVGIIFQDFSKKDSKINETIHNLYLDKDVGYILLIGNDLIHDSFGNASDTGELAFQPYQYPHRYQIPLGEAECPSVALSALVSPNYQDLNQKIEFILDQLDSYIQFHKDPENYLSNFSRSYLRIVNLDVSDEYISFNFSSPDIGEIKYRWNLPKRDILSSDINLKSEIRNERPMILDIMGHGWGRILAWQKTIVTWEVKNVTLEKSGTTDEWLEFTEGFIPTILTINQGCGAMIIDDYNLSTYGDSSVAKFCCWPQAFLKSGALAYISGNHARVYNFTSSDFFGQALRKTRMGAEYFGDLFAHL